MFALSPELPDGLFWGAVWASTIIVSNSYLRDQIMEPDFDCLLIFNELFVAISTCIILTGSRGGVCLERSQGQEEIVKEQVDLKKKIKSIVNKECKGGWEKRKKECFKGRICKE